jgi:hypothetical protein
MTNCNLRAKFWYDQRQTAHQLSSCVAPERERRGDAFKKTTKQQIWELGGVVCAVQKAQMPPTRQLVMSTSLHLFY